MKKIARRCPVALTEINKFDNLDENNIGLRRSGNGLEAKTILKIHGKKATKKITKDQILRKEDYE
jgi:sialic acid synthase SpsE